MDDAFDIRFLTGAFRRRWPLILTPAVIGSVLAGGVAMLLPPVYSSAARILVESQQIPSELARSTVAVGAVESIRSIEQRLTTRQNLLDLAARHEVFAGRGDLSATDIVARMREATKIQTVGVSNRRSARRDTTVTTVEISFRADRAQVAAQVANDFLTQVLEQNVQQRSARASETLDFFNREVERLGGALAAVEARISSYKRENDLALPQNLEFRRSELSTLERDALARQSRRLALDESRRALEAAIALGQTVAVGQPRSPQAIELDRLRAQLAQQRALYAETHPVIRGLRAQIASLEAAEGAVLTDAAPAAEGAPVEATPPSPMGEARVQIQRIAAELRLIQEQDDRDAERMAQLRTAIGQSPQVEIELGALTREFDSLQAQYRDAVLKQAEAATGERLEINQQAERFEVIEQPQTPDRPVSPNRALIAGAGGALSLGIGVALAALVEILNQSLRSARDMERRLELRPIVAIPYIFTEAELRRRRWMVRVALFGALVMIPLALIVVDQLYMPLPILFEQLSKRTGLGEALTILQKRLGI